jgi:hypothetical protein
MGASGDQLAIRVECHAGHRGEETPRRLWIGDRPVVVVAMLDGWLAPDHRYFKARGDDGGVYIVRFDVAADRWEMTMFQREGPEGTTRSEPDDR